MTNYLDQNKSKLMLRSSVILRNNQITKSRIYLKDFLVLKCRTPKYQTLSCRTNLKFRDKSQQIPQQTKLVMRFRFGLATKYHQYRHHPPLAFFFSNVYNKTIKQGRDIMRGTRHATHAILCSFSPVTFACTKQLENCALPLLVVQPESEVQLSRATVSTKIG